MNASAVAILILELSGMASDMEQYMARPCDSPAPELIMFTPGLLC